MRTSEFDYRLPAELIAQHPLAARDESRMLIVERGSGSIRDGSFRDFPELLSAGDIVVLNDTRVFPARVHGLRAETGGGVEVLFLREKAPGKWMALTRSGGKLREGEELVLADKRLRVRILQRRGTEGDLLGLPDGFDLERFLDEHGEVPLPPYIERDDPETDGSDAARYQTVYAAERGAVAAPTAGLHFTDDVLEALAQRGVQSATLTLHVGPGTFRPVKSERIEEHPMDAEVFSLPNSSAEKINAARRCGGRCVAVGTTSTRTLESQTSADGVVRAGEGQADLFIYPPYEFKAVDALLTNFHLPKSTLLMLVAAFAGHELTMAAYRHAVENRYRFYSYGDCCFFI